MHVKSSKSLQSNLQSSRWEDGSGYAIRDGSIPDSDDLATWYR